MLCIIMNRTTLSKTLVKTPFSLVPCLVRDAIGAADWAVGPGMAKAQLLVAKVAGEQSDCDIGQTLRYVSEDGMTANGAQCAATGLNHDMDAGHGRISIIRLASHIPWQNPSTLHTQCISGISTVVMLCYTKKRVYNNTTVGS